MSHRCLAAALVVVASVALAPALAAAQSAAETPSLRTAWGDPALSGIWDFRSITPLQRPEQFADREFLTAEEAANLEQATVDRELELLLRPARRTQAGGNVDRGEDGALGAYNDFWLDRGTTTQTTRRTSLIIDPPNGRMPPLTEEAQRRREERAAYRREHPADSWEDRGLNDRCMFTTGLPMVPSAYNNNVHVFQNADHVAMVIEMTTPCGSCPSTAVRGPSRPSGSSWASRAAAGRATPSWSRRCTSTGSRVCADRRPTRAWSSASTRVAPDVIEYEFTIEDPATWTRPWTARVELQRTDEPLYEYACHEGNYSMEGILAGARADERKAAEAHGSGAVSRPRRMAAAPRTCRRRTAC